MRERLAHVAHARGRPGLPMRADRRASVTVRPSDWMDTAGDWTPEERVDVSVRERRDTDKPGASRAQGSPSEGVPHPHFDGHTSSLRCDDPRQPIALSHRTPSSRI